jgi:TonB family protein
MTHRSLLLIAVLFSVPSGIVGAPPLTRAEADRLFANGDFKAAATAYRSLLDARSALPAPSTHGEPISPGPDVVEPTITLPATIPAVDKGGHPVLLALISETGSVLDVRVVKPSGPAVDAAAIKALRAAHVTPATHAGAPARMWVMKAIAIPAVQ